MPKCRETTYSLGSIWEHKSHRPPLLNFSQCHDPHGNISAGRGGGSAECELGGGGGGRLGGSRAGSTGGGGGWEGGGGGTVWDGLLRTVGETNSSKLVRRLLPEMILFLGKSFENCLSAANK